MAPSDGTEPPDGSSNKTYKCCIKTKAKTLICIICETAYHVGHFKTINGAKRISDTFIICDQHADLNLTSKHDHILVAPDVRVIIAQIKLEAKQLVRQDLLDEIQDETQKTLNETILEESDVLEKNLLMETTLLKKLNEELNDKNTILKQLNNELTDKNNLLTQKLNTNGNNSQLSNSTFAQIISNAKPKSKRVPKIVIKKTKKEANMEIVERAVTRCLIQDKTIQAKKIYKKNNDELIISCLKEESVNTALGLLSNRELKEVCEVQKEQVLNPKVRVIGIDNILELDDAALEEDINMRNFKNFDKQCRVLHSYTNNKTKLQSIVLEVTGEIHKFIKENNNRIFVGYQNCKVFDILNVAPCRNCARYGHNATKCRNESVCLKCADRHETSKCNGENENKCINCDYTNKKFGTHYDTKHMATDSHACKILLGKIQKLVDATDYIIKPTIPRHAGKRR